MGIKDALLPEFDHEMATTRRLLERLPEAEFAWKPHDRSMALGQLAGHIANLPQWCSAVLASTVFDLDSLPADRPQMPVSRAALIEEFDAKVGAARNQLTSTMDAEFMVPWTLKKG